MATIYVLIKVGETQNAAQQSTIEAKLNEHSGDTWRRLDNGTYLVAVTEPTLTREVSDKTGISDGEVGSYNVTKLDPFFGWASKEIWEWIETYGEN